MDDFFGNAALQLLEYKRSLRQQLLGTVAPALHALLDDADKRGRGGAAADALSRWLDAFEHERGSIKAAAATGNVMCGWLRKLSSSGMLSNRRWVVLDGTSLSYYTDRGETDLRGVLNLAGCSLRVGGKGRGRFIDPTALNPNVAMAGGHWFEIQAAPPSPPVGGAASIAAAGGAGAAAPSIAFNRASQSLEAAGTGEASGEIDAAAAPPAGGRRRLSATSAFGFGGGGGAGSGSASASSASAATAPLNPFHKSKKAYMFVCASAEERDGWAAAITEAVRLASAEAAARAWQRRFVAAPTPRAYAAALADFVELCGAASEPLRVPADWVRVSMGACSRRGAGGLCALSGAPASSAPFSLGMTEADASFELLPPAAAAAAAVVAAPTSRSGLTSPPRPSAAAGGGGGEGSSAAAGGGSGGRFFSRLIHGLAGALPSGGGDGAAPSTPGLGDGASSSGGGGEAGGSRSPRATGAGAVGAPFSLPTSSSSATSATTGSTPAPATATKISKVLARRAERVKSTSDAARKAASSLKGQLAPGKLQELAAAADAAEALHEASQAALVAAEVSTWRRRAGWVPGDRADLRQTQRDWVRDAVSLQGQLIKNAGVSTLVSRLAEAVITACNTAYAAWAAAAASGSSEAPPAASALLSLHRPVALGGVAALAPSSANAGIPAFEAQLLEFAREVLVCSSRTVIGGDTYDAVELVFGCPERVVVAGCDHAPGSGGTGPVEVDVVFDWQQQEEGAAAGAGAPAGVSEEGGALPTAPVSSRTVGAAADASGRSLGRAPFTDDEDDDEDEDDEEEEENGGAGAGLHRSAREGSLLIGDGAALPTGPVRRPVSLRTGSDSGAGLLQGSGALAPAAAPARPAAPRSGAPVTAPPTTLHFASAADLLPHLSLRVKAQMGYRLVALPGLDDDDEEEGDDVGRSHRMSSSFATSGSEGTVHGRDSRASGSGSGVVGIPGSLGVVTATFRRLFPWSGAAYSAEIGLRAAAKA